MKSLYSKFLYELQSLPSSQAEVTSCTDATCLPVPDPPSIQHKWPQKAHPRHLPSGKPPSLMINHCLYSVVRLTTRNHFLKICSSETTVKIFLATCTVG